MKHANRLAGLALGAALSQAVISAPALAGTEQYKIDPAHSFVTFEISHLGFSTLQGRFNDISGSFAYDPDDPAKNTIEMTIRTASVDTNWAERDKHLRSADFLHVEEHPTATFRATAFERREGKAQLTGDLTLRGVTRPITVEVSEIGQGKDPWGGYRRGFVGTYTLNRSDFGIDYNLGPAAESLQMQVVVEGIRQ